MIALTQNFLRECLDYEPETGTLRWRVRPRGHFQTLRAHISWNTKHSTKVAGGFDNRGYRRISIDGRFRKSRRIIWIWMTGRTPVEVDHKNGNRGDNRWQNLRDTNRLGNQRNRKVNSNSTTTVAGVYIDKRTGRFQAQISVRGKQKRLGSFETLDAAVQARRAAEHEYDFHKCTQEPCQTSGSLDAAVLTA
jgi:HNH endonuclease